MNKILILGGYGNFGKRISTQLAKAGYQIIIAGRNSEKATKLASELFVESVAFDVNKDLAKQLKTLKPKVVINTCGPFQNADYSVARICIEHGVNYIDLADARDFVVGITELDALAKKHNVLVVSGASSVPGLSSAVIEEFKHEFTEIESLRYGISPGQKADRGLATTQGILSYLGKKLKPSAGRVRYGWQDIYSQEYPELGTRWLGNCDIPDLDLFPRKYGIKNIQFSAGFENRFLHFGVWAVSWLIRLGLPIKLEKHAAKLLKLSHWFDRFGTSDGGMHVIISGKGQDGKPHQRKWFIIAKNGDGPQIPCVPAIILAKKIINEQLQITGALPCLAMLSLSEYMAELQEFEISQHTN